MCCSQSRWVWGEQVGHFPGRPTGVRVTLPPGVFEPLSGANQSILLALLWEAVHPPKVKLSLFLATLSPSPHEPSVGLQSQVHWPRGSDLKSSFGEVGEGVSGQISSENAEREAFLGGSLHSLGGETSFSRAPHHRHRPPHLPALPPEPAASASSSSGWQRCPEPLRPHAPRCPPRILLLGLREPKGKTHHVLLECQVSLQPPRPLELESWNPVCLGPMSL